MNMIEKLQLISEMDVTQIKKELFEQALESLELLYSNNENLLQEEIDWKGELTSEIKKLTYQDELNIQFRQTDKLYVLLKITLDIFYEDNNIGYYQYITDLNLNHVDEFFVIH